MTAGAISSTLSAPGVEVDTLVSKFTEVGMTNRGGDTGEQMPVIHHCICLTQCLAHHMI